jgi:hypothetical protein
MLTAQTFSKKVMYVLIKNHYYQYQDALDNDVQACRYISDGHSLCQPFSYSDGIEFHVFRRSA